MGDLVRNLQQQNNELLDALRQKDAELRDLREVAEAAADLQSQDLQAGKIIELSKKVRTLNLALEKEKQRNAKLQAESGSPARAQSGLDPEAVEDVARSLVEQAAEAADAASREAAMWKERTQQQTNKISQMEQKVFSLEIEYKKLQRALVREVGEDVPLAKVLDEGSDWKGRREQLLALREQVKQLKAAQGMPVQESRTDAVARKAIGKIANSRSAEVDKLAAELAASRQEVEAITFKHDAAISRRKVMENEMSALKEKVAIILEKTQNDDRLIAALRAEVAALKRSGGQQQQQGSGSKACGLAASKSTGMLDEETWQELSTLRRRCQEQQQQVDRQEQIILALQTQAEAAQQRPGSGAAAAAGAAAASAAKEDGAARLALQQQLRILEIENARLQEVVRVMRSQLQGEG